MDDVERIEIIRGGHSVLHPFAIGGVINIITKKGKKTGEMRPEGTVRAGIGKYGANNTSASINGGVTEFVGYHFSASRQESDGYFRNNFQENRSLNGHLTFYLPREATLSLGAKYSNVNYGFPVINDPARADYDADFPVYKPADADALRHLPTSVQTPGPPYPEWTRHTTYLDGIFQIPVGPGTLKFHAFQQMGRRWTSYYQGAVFNEDTQSNDETQGYILEYRDVGIGRSHSLTFGLEYQELGNPPADDIIYKVQSGYAQDVISIGERWRITPGFRYYKVDMDTYYSWMEQGLGAAAWPTEGKEQEESGLYPSLKADFQATDTTALYAAVSRSYRLPCP
ncbi:MAG: TonB-dependent receptor, partial [Deltaproteobacteria bacterium]|nr:TonB-dependent receptor [Deltaproteobacteria bacterium]